MKAIYNFQKIGFRLRVSLLIMIFLAALTQVMAIGNLTVSVTNPSPSICIGNSLAVSGTATPTTGVASYYTVTLYGPGGYNQSFIYVLSITAGMEIPIAESFTGLTTSGTYSLTIETIQLPPPSNEVVDAGTTSLAITVYDLPTATITGTNTTCFEQSVTISGASATNYSALLWTTTGAGTLSNATTLTPTFNPNIGFSGDVELLLTATGAGSCSATAATATCTVTVKGAVTATAGGSSTICSSGTATVSGATATNYTSLLWIHNGLGSFTSGETGLTPTYAAAAGDASSTVTLTLTATCGTATATATYSVIVTTGPTAAAGGTQTICTTSTATVSGASATDYGTILWTVNTSGAGTLTNTATLTPTFTPTTGWSGTADLLMTVWGNGGCASSTATAHYTVVVQPIPTATISYSGTSFCMSVATPQAVTLNGTGAYSGGTYSSTAGLSINTSTGAITPSTSTAATYTVTYTGLAGECAAATATTTVTITAIPTATISYSGTSFCMSVATPQAVTLNGTGVYSGGTYTSTTGLSINTSTGEVTPSTSTAATYVVTYTGPESGGCSAATATTSVTITAIPTATISYAGTPFCKSIATAQPVTLNGTGVYSGGTYSSISGLTIDGSTGAITPSTSTAATYLVTYTGPTSGGCAGATATASVTIDAIPTIGLTSDPATTAQTVCINSAITDIVYSVSSGTTTPTVSGLPSGVTGNWVGITFTIAGTPTTATGSPFTYTLTNVNGACSATATGTISVNPKPTATITIPTGYPTIICGSGYARWSIALTGTAPWTINLTTAQSGLPPTTVSIGLIAASPYLYDIVTLTRSTTVTINSVQDANCLNASTQGDAIVEVNPIPSAPTGLATQTFCSSANPTVAELTTTSGTGIQWYAAATGGTALATSTALVNGTHYYASQTALTCESTSRLDVTVTLTVTAPPTGSASQTFCSFANPTVASLAATGTTLIWYNASTGGTAYATTTALVTGTHYYASQTVDGCESTSRLDVTVTITVTPGPTALATQTFCSFTNPTVASLVATGTGIKWYSVSTGGTSLATTTALVNANYYASQTVDGCESTDRAGVAVTVTVTPVPTGTAAQTFCSINAPTVANLTATGTAIKWYSVSTGGTALATTVALVTATHYYASQTIDGCESAVRFDVTATVTVVAVPTGSASQSFCSYPTAPTVANLAATGTAIKWYSVSTGGTALATSVALVSGNHYYATQTVGSCESASRFDVTATITVTPVPTGSATQTFCSADAPTVANLTATGTSIQWYAASTGGTALSTTVALVNGTHYYATQTVGSCESSTRLNVTVVINTTPGAPTGSATQSFCSNVGTVADLVATGTGIKWYAATTGGTALATTTALVNATHYFGSQTVNGCESVLRLDVLVSVTQAPTIVLTSAVGTDAQGFCFPGTITDIVYTVGGNWLTYDVAGLPAGIDVNYDNVTKRITLSGTPSVAGTYNYTVTATGTAPCSDAIASGTISSYLTPAPTGTAAQSFCTGATVADLTATGTLIKWYAAATGGTALATTVALVNGTHYFASQTLNSCESPTRFDVTATVYTTAAPTGTAAQSFCASASPTVANLVATGTAIQWYAASTGGTALATTVALVNNTSYYASQTLNGCESAARFTVTVTLTDPAAPTGAATQSFCSSSTPTVANLTATGTGILWYAASTGGTALATTTALVNNTHYFASQTVGGCESSARLNVTVTFTITPAPTGTAAQTFCAGATVANLVATGTAIQWYAASTGGTALATSVALVNGTHYYASQTIGGCESPARFEVTVTVTTTPAPTGTAAQSFCSGTNPTVANLVATGTTIKWYAASSGGTALASTVALVNNTHYFASQTVGGCESVARFDVTVTINTTPGAPTGTAAQSFCASSSPTVANLTATGTAIQWYAATSGGTALASTVALVNGTHYFASQTVGGCESTLRFDVTVTVNPISVGGTVTGGTTICTGSTSGVLTLAGHTGTVVKWQSAVAPFTTWTDIVNTATTYTSGPLTVTTQFRAVVQSGVCAAANSAATTVTVNAASVGGTVTGGTTICAGSPSGVLTLSGHTGTVVKWQSAIAPFTTWTDIVNTTTTYTSGPLTETTQFRAVVQSGVCAAANSVATTVTVTIAPVATASNNGPLCAGFTLNLIGGPAGMTSYAWTGPNGFTSTVQNPTIANVTAAAAGVYSLVVTNSSGCNSVAATTTVVINATPVATAANNGPMCEGGTLNLYGQPAGASSYLWAGPNGYTSNVQNPVITNVTAAATGQYVLLVTNSNGCQGIAVTSVTIYAKPATTATNNGPLCSGSTLNLVGAPAGMASYAWTGPNGYTSNVQNPTIANATVANAGVYTLIATNANGCSASANTTVVVNPIPETPVITQNGMVLTSSAPAGNQWYYNGTAIPGATEQTYEVTHNTGWYWVMVTLNGCSSPISNKIWVEVVGVPEMPASASFTIYPVPNNGEFTASIRYPVDDIFTIVVYNQLGEQLYELRNAVTTGGKLDTQIDLRPIPSGTYTVVFRNSTYKVVKRVIVFNK